MVKTTVKTILVVDDHPVARYGLRGCLEDRWSMYIKVLEAGRREEAFSIIRKSHVDLLVVDLEMEQPDDGEKLVTKMRSQGIRIPCVMIYESIMSADYAAKFAEKNNLQGMFSKSADVDVITSHIGNLLSLPMH